MTPEEKRAQRLQLLEDDIGRKLRESEDSGELMRSEERRVGKECCR